MRHIVNFGLLLAFFTLAVTGVLAFLQPFSLTTTRLHILFGLLTLVGVLWHLAHRTAYFKKQIAGTVQKNQTGLRAASLAGLMVGWAILLVAGIGNWPPIQQLIEQGHEARHRAEIVRTSPLAGFADNNHQRLISRQGDKGADVGLSLLVRFGHDEPPPAMAVWAETTTGAMIETLYIDPRLAYDAEPSWGGRPTPRHHILPIWRQRHTLVSGIDPHGQVDAFTATTPTHSFSLEDQLKLGQKKEFVLCVEANAPHDPNQHFQDPHLGQPSLWYTAYIKLDSPQPYSLMALTGHGGTTEHRGEVQYDLETITTAKKLIDLLLVRITPMAKASSDRLPGKSDR